jgi:uncharacterized membrane protein YozB (DUF420 family)
MASETVAVAAANRLAQFAPYHKWDRNFFLTYVVLIWFGVVMGFGGDIQDHIVRHKPAFPLIVHFHAVVFVGWVVVLTAQVLLIRRRRPDLHMRLGRGAMILAAIMVVLGPATAIIVERNNFGTPDSDPAFFAVQFTDILAFAGLAAAAFAFALRGDPSAHKRLILLATLYISDAAFARFLGDGLHAFLGDGFLPFMVEAYLVPDVLMLGLGAYDLATRGRLHPAYVAGLLWVAANEITGSFLYHSPAWKPVALGLIGH